MIRFNLTKGEGEHTFVAAGMHCESFRHVEYEITGTWNPQSDDGKTPIELKIAYSTDPWSDSELKGVFDPEENSLRGTVVRPFFHRTGEFVFKRDPDLVRFYPAPSFTNARARWRFAMTLVLDRVRREAWSPQRIFQRIQDRKLFMKLFLRLGGKILTDDEWEESNNLMLKLYEADMQFCISLINVDPNTAADFK